MRSEQLRKGMITAGERLISNSGRALSPVPQFKASSNAGTVRAMKALAAWLLDEAKKEAVFTFNDWHQTLLQGVSVNNLSQADYDMMNLIVFGDEDGPSDFHRLAA